jgi:RNA polymerase sigma-70 factor (ECF subfamily)
VASSAAQDPALIARAQAGDSQAFDALITPLLARALQLARRLLEHEEDAEDLVQDACLRALDRLDQHDPSRPFAPWFFRLLVNLGLNQQQSRRVRRHQPLSETTAASTPSPVEDAVRVDVQERFSRAVASLSERQRQVVMLHEVEGWSAADIAAELDVAVQTVRWHLHDARRTLRPVLAMLRDGDEGTTPETG